MAPDPSTTLSKSFALKCSSTKPTAATKGTIAANAAYFTISPGSAICSPFHSIGQHASKHSGAKVKTRMSSEHPQQKNGMAAVIDCLKTDATIVANPCQPQPRNICESGWQGGHSDYGRPRPSKFALIHPPNHGDCPWLNSPSGCRLPGRTPVSGCSPSMRPNLKCSSSNSLSTTLYNTNQIHEIT